MTLWKKLTLGLAAFAPLLMAPTPGGYPSNPTFQSETVVNAITGNTANFSGAVSAASFTGAISGGAISGTTGTFSGAVSGTQFTGNLIGGTLSATTGNFSSTVIVGNGLTGSFASPQFNIETTQYAVGVDASGNVFLKNTNNGTFLFPTSAGVNTASISQGNLSAGSGSFTTLSASNSTSNTAVFANTGTTTQALQAINTSSGSGSNVIFATSNLVDADWNITISQQGAGTKFAKIGPSVNVPVNTTGTNWVFKANPSGGTTVETDGAANAYAGYIQGSSTSGQSYGLVIEAGTTVADQGLTVNNSANLINYFRVFGDGSILAGSPTGSQKGVGTINAQGLYVNGLPLGAATASASGTISAGCTTTPAITAKFRQTGNTVTVSIPNVTCTDSSISTLTIALTNPVPPTTTNTALGPCENSSVTATCIYTFLSAGTGFTVAIVPQNTFSGTVGTGAVGITTTVTYSIDP